VNTENVYGIEAVVRAWVCGRYVGSNSSTVSDYFSDATVSIGPYNYGTCGPQSDDYQSWAKPSGIFHWAPYVNF
jgi:hypothetical protein